LSSGCCAAVLPSWTPPPLAGVTGGDVAGLTLVGEGLPAGAGPARLLDPVSARGADVDVFGYPGDPPRRNGAWASCRLRGLVGGGVVQLDPDSESVFAVQPGYSGSPGVVSDDSGDAVVGMLAVAGGGGDRRDAYALPVSTLAHAWADVVGALTLPPSPYRPLRAFDASDEAAGLFVGREDDVGRLRRKVAESPLVVVVGHSGVGKSSLVAAGLAPALRAEGWQVVSFRPGTVPFAALAMALAKLEPAGLPSGLADLEHRAERLWRDGLAKLAGQLGALAGGPVLLFADQFEEVLAADDCAEFLLRVLPEPGSDDGPLRLVCTLRADLLPDLLAHPEMATACRMASCWCPRRGSTRSGGRFWSRPRPVVWASRAGSPSRSPVTPAPATAGCR
jgi:AAA ATPase domain